MILKTAKLSIATGFRKWSIMAVILVVGILFRVSGYINGQEFVDLIRYTSVAFFASNVGEHAITAIKEWVFSQALQKKGPKK